MKTLRHVLTIAFATFAATRATASGAGTCPLANIKSARELHDFLSLRAVEVIKLASQPRTHEDSRLATLVAPSASFSLGGGDVVQPLGTGLEGAHALAYTINADVYRYLGWDYMDMPVDACSSQKITVEFVDSGSKSIARVDFTFDGGLLVKAAGWSDTFQTGPLKDSHPRR